MTQALYRKWRPQTFEQVVGQEHVVQTLRNALALGRVGHAYLFAGLRGTGKTTMARLLAKAVNCLADDLAHRPCNECTVCRAVNEGRLLDLIEIDAASHTGVDDVRELRDKVGFRPNEGRYKVYIIDEVHRFSGSAFDALLKTIEEPPPHAIFILATTEIHKVPATVLSRCQRFDFRRIPLRQIVGRLQQLAAAEGIDAEPEALGLIARSATGSLRDAESLLDQLAATAGSAITLARVQATLGTIDAALVVGLVDSLVARDVAAGLALINQALDRGADLRQFTRQIVNYLREMLLIKLQGQALLDLSEESLQGLTAQAERISTPTVVQAVKRFNQAEAELRGGWQPQLPLELALVEVIVGSGDEVAAAPTSASRDHPASPAPANASTEPEPASHRVTELTLETALQSWPRVLEKMRQHGGPDWALLNSARPAAVAKDVVVLEVDRELTRNKLSERRRKQLVEDALSQVCGRRYQVEYRVVASASDGGRDQAPAHDTWADDPVAQWAVRELGAEVKPIDKRRQA